MDNVEIKNKILLHDGYCRVNRYDLRQRLFDGNWSPVYSREIVERVNAVGALPYDPIHGQVVLIEQFRAATLEKSSNPWLLEIVAGVMDKDYPESAEDLVRREMREEAGLEVEALIPMYDYFTTPGYSTEKLILFCTKVDATQAPKFCGLKEEHEDIKIHVLSTQEAFAAVRSGRINNSSSIIALQWLELNLTKVNERWVI